MGKDEYQKRMKKIYSRASNPGWVSCLQRINGNQPKQSRVIESNDDNLIDIKFDSVKEVFELLSKPIDIASIQSQNEVSTQSILKWFFSHECCKFNTLKFVEMLWESGHADKSMQPHIIKHVMNSKFVNSELINICVFYPCKIGE